MLMNVILGCGLCFVYLTGVSSLSQNPGVLDKIKTGLEYASSYIETAKEIADLVSESLRHRNKKRNVDNFRDSGEKTFGKQKNYFGTQGLVAAFFKLLGLDPPKINAIAVNSAIFLAQMISTAFNLKSKIEKPRSMDVDNSEELESESGEENWAQGPMRLILGSKNERVSIEIQSIDCSQFFVYTIREVQNLVRQARDKNLPIHLIDRLDGFDTECIRLLVCKVSPVIRAAQDTLGEKSRDAKWDITSWLPSREDFQENGDKCEKIHDACQLFPES